MVSYKYVLFLPINVPTLMQLFTFPHEKKMFGILIEVLKHDTFRLMDFFVLFTENIQTLPYIFI